MDFSPVFLASLPLTRISSLNISSGRTLSCVFLLTVRPHIPLSSSCLLRHIAYVHPFGSHGSLVQLHQLVFPLKVKARFVQLKVRHFGLQFSTFAKMQNTPEYSIWLSETLAKFKSYRPIIVKICFLYSIQRIRNIMAPKSRISHYIFDLESFNLFNRMSAQIGDKQ